MQECNQLVTLTLSINSENEFTYKILNECKFNYFFLYIL